MLSPAQRESVRFYLGWSARFHQIDSALEQALSAVGFDPETEARITNPISGTPPGLLSLLEDVDAKLLGGHGRLKASQVGSITLNAAEIDQLRGEGRRHAARLAAVLGVVVRVDVFSESSPGRGNYVGV